MKKEITEYELAEDTVTKIQCASCDKCWDNRDIRGNQGVNTIVLDATVEESSYGPWRERNCWNGAYIYTLARINGYEIEDYCNECWDALFSVKAKMKVEEPEYYVEEQTRREYYCDFCDDGMGEESDHEVTLNPRLEVEGERDVHDFEIGKPVGCRSDSRIYAKRDDVFDCCSACADEIFNRRSVMPVSTYICAKIKDLFYPRKA